MGQFNILNTGDNATSYARDGATLNDADGLRVDLPGRWVCVRASNTEPIMRIIAEAPDQPAAEALVAEVRQLADEVMASE